MLFRQTGLICEDALVQNDMNEVLNDKLGTSQVNYPSNKWADNVSVLGEPLPMKTASGSIAHFTDGTKNVPLDTGIFYFNPVQASGTPTPSSPIAIYGHTGLTINRSGADMSDPTTYPVSWTSHGTVYGGYYDSVTGELWKTHYKFSGSDITSVGRSGGSGGLTTFSITLANNDLPSSVANTCVSNQFSRDIASGNEGRMTQSATVIYFVVSTSRLESDTASGGLAWLQDNNVDFCYELATPVLVAVIDPTKIKTFEGVNNIWNDGGGISEVGYRSKASSGGGIPTFTETILAEDTNSTGTLDFDGADYHDYELIKCYLKNTSTLREFEVLMTPQSIDDMFQYFGSGICFNQYNSSIFAYYDENSSGNWVRGASDRLICTKVCGLTGQGFSIEVTNLYRKQAVQSTSQAITTLLDLNDFDCIIASANNNTTDCVPCCYVMSGIVHNDSLRNQMPNVANAWANAQEIVITEHEISSYNWFCVDAIKFT